MEKTNSYEYYVEEFKQLLKGLDWSLKNFAQKTFYYMIDKIGDDLYDGYETQEVIFQCKKIKSRIDVLSKSELTKEIDSYYQRVKKQGKRAKNKNTEEKFKEYISYIKMTDDYNSIKPSLTDSNFLKSSFKEKIDKLFGVQDSESLKELILEFKSLLERVSWDNEKFCTEKCKSEYESDGILEGSEEFSLNYNKIYNNFSQNISERRGSKAKLKTYISFIKNSSAFKAKESNEIPDKIRFDKNLRKAFKKLKDQDYCIGD